jgi:hypothetical protein
MSKQNIVTTNTSTDLFYENLADPVKLRPIKQTIQIINNNDSEHEDSFIVDINNITNKLSPKLNFNSENKKESEKYDLQEYNKYNLLISDKKVSDKKVSDKKVSDKKVSDRKVSDRKVSDRKVSDRKVSDRKVSDRKISDRKESDIKESDRKESDYGNYVSRLSSRKRSERKDESNEDYIIDNLQKAMNNNLKKNLNNFSYEDMKNSQPPVIKPFEYINKNTLDQNEQTLNQNEQTLNQNNINQPNIGQYIGKYITSEIPKYNNNIATQKEIRFKKMEILAKLIHIKSSNIELTKHYSMESDLEDMEAELKYHSDIQTKNNGIQLAKSFMCNAITGLEFMNERYDPFGFKLKGWGNQIKTNKDDFDEVFGELLEKYKGEGKKMEPEIKLAIMLILSAGSFHMSQAISTGLPGLDDVIKNNPQLMSKIQSNINKSISGPTELEKKQELYNNIKKMHEQKIKTQTNSQSKQESKIQNEVQSKQESKIQNEVQSKFKQTKPTSVKNLLQNIKKSIPLDSITNSITIGETIDTESENSNRYSISRDVKTKSRLQKRNKIQFQNQ